MKNVSSRVQRLTVILQNQQDGPAERVVGPEPEPMRNVVIERLASALVSGALGGLSSAIISGILAAFVVPMPIDGTHHVVGYSIGGLMCGVLSGFMGVYMSMKRAERIAARAPQRQ